MSKFNIGDQVVEKENVQANRSFPVMSVVSFLDDHVLVAHIGFSFQGEFHKEDYVSDVGSRGWREAVLRYEDSELFSLEEAYAEQRKLENAKQNLEEEFARVRVYITAEIDMATKLMKKAAETAVSVGKDLSDLKEECRGLFHVLDDNGWRHSNMKC